MIETGQRSDHDGEVSLNEERVPIQQVMKKGKKKMATFKNESPIKSP